MLFKILKLFGLDVPSRVEAATASLEVRVDRVIDRLRDLAQGAVLLAVLGVAALISALMAAAAGLFAVYRLTADAYGEYAGLGVVAAILITATVVLLAVMIAKVRSLEAPKVTTLSPTNDERVSDARLSAAAEPQIPDPTFEENVPAVEAIALPHAPASAGDLIEPLTYILSDVIRIPTLGNPFVDQFLDKLRGAAHDNAEDTVHRAANVVRFGSRLDLLAVLGGTAAFAWLVTRNAQMRR
jgi:uncharacterized membrane protein